MKPITSIQKRDLLAAKKFDSDDLREYAEDFFHQERFGDAFAFYSKLGDAEGLRKVKEKVIEIADPEVLWRLAYRHAEMVSAEDWRRCGEAAMISGKFRNAAFAFGRIGDTESMARAEAQFKPAAPEAPPADGSPSPS